VISKSFKQRSPNALLAQWSGLRIGPTRLLDRFPVFFIFFTFFATQQQQQHLFASKGGLPEEHQLNNAGHP